MATHRIRTTLRSNEMRVNNAPLTLVCVTAAERKRIGWRYVHRLPSGLFVAKAVGQKRGVPIEITGVTDLLEEAIENSVDS